jgi:PAS domain S-box-containing protein
VSERATPAIADLEERNAPCFLWDGARLRVVWANSAGLRFFGAETLFDLIDRPFHPTEPGAKRIVELSDELARKSPRRELLSFPSTGLADPIAVTCFSRALPDGRPGVLVVAEATAADRSALPQDMAQAFAALPVAAVLIEADGVMSQHNAAARDFIAHLPKRTLAQLLGDEGAAAEFATRLRSSGTFSQVRRVELPYGKRDVRMVAKWLDGQAGDDERYVMTLEDVTDRRALERALTGPAQQEKRGPLERPAIAPTSGERTAPEAAPTAPREAAAVITPESAPVVAAGVDVPEIVAARLEESSEAIFIVRGEALLHANRRALSLLGFESIAAMRQRRDIATSVAAAGPVVSIADASGRAHELKITKSQIPWLSGPAMQVRAQSVPVTVSATSQAVASETVSPAPAPPSPRAPTETSEPKHDNPLPEAAVPAEAGWRPDDRELRAILDTASDGIVMLDGQGNIRSFSAAAEALFGKATSEVIGRPFESLLTPETRKIFRDYLSALADSGLASIFNDGREVEAIAGEGSSLPLFLTINRFHDQKTRSDGEPPFCAVVRDITQWKKTEAELRQAKDEAERTSAQKSEFLARISHELRTPLNAILGFSEVMRLERFGRIQNDRYRSYVDDIHTSGGHLLSLINDLLDLSKVEAGRLELDFTSVDLSEITDQAIRALTEQAKQARVTLRKNLPADLPSVVADQRSMRQILLNLLSNAVKFTDPGGQVTVSASLTKAGELVLRVKDTGIGMSEGELKEALEPFRRVSRDSRGDVEGTGLGLPLTKALTEANRAAFSISSEPGKGTVAEITYPTTRVLAD